MIMLWPALEGWEYGIGTEALEAAVLAGRIDCLGIPAASRYLVVILSIF
jgi:hypothetical protein